jgi:hypothetical protein
MEWDMTTVSDGQLGACQALVYSLLQRCDSTERDRGYALALVSAHPGAGVSHIQRLLTQMLNENEAECAIAVDCNDLGIGYLTQEGANQYVRSRNKVKRSPLAPRSGVARYPDRIGHLNALREEYRFVLLDCHSLRERTDVLGLAQVVDGSIIVVECLRTTTAQLTELERSIEKYGGAILGSVMNKTTDSLPRWMGTLLEKAGV